MKILQANYEAINYDESSGRYNGYDKMNDCYIVGRNTYYPNCLLTNNKILVSPYNEKIMSLNKESFYDDNEFNFVPKINHDHHVTNPVYFFIYNFDNYYHFIYDTLPYLINYKILKEKYANLQLLINYPNKNNKFYQFNVDILKFFDIKDCDYLIHNDNTMYSEIYVSDSLTHAGKSNHKPHSAVYDFFNNIKPTKNLMPCDYNKIYISRRTWTKENNDNIGTNYTTRRRCVNEDKLVDIVNNFGYKEIFAEDLTFNEKVYVFSRAKHIVGIIGGGMCNLLFSNKETKVLCIVSPDFLNINHRFKYSMDNTQIMYFNDCQIYGPDGKLPLYTRIRVTDIKSTHYDKIGEISEFDEQSDQYRVNLSNNDVAGFNNDLIFECEYFSLDQISPLDNGLNSPFVVDEEKFIKALTILN